MQTITIPANGELWAGQGGHFAGIYQHDGKTLALIVAPAETEVQDVTWADKYTRVVGAESKIDGAANTKALLEAGYPCKAAQACAAVEQDGHNDFFLPSQRQLNLIYATAPELLAADWYWSSSQYAGNSYCAWCQYFGDGTQSTLHKSYKLRARAVRTIQL